MGGNNFGSQYNMYNYDSKTNEQEELALFAAFKETWRFQWDSKINVFKGDQVEKTHGKLDQCDMVAKFGMFDKDWYDNVGDGNNRWGIEITKDADPILHICMAIICDAIGDKEK